MLERKGREEDRKGERNGRKRGRETFGRERAHTFSSFVVTLDLNGSRNFRPTYIFIKNQHLASHFCPLSLSLPLSLSALLRFLFLEFDCFFETREFLAQLRGRGETSSQPRPAGLSVLAAISSSITVFHRFMGAFSLPLHLHLHHCFPGVAAAEGCRVRSTRARYEPGVEITKVPGVDARVSPPLIWSPRFRHRASLRSAMEKTTTTRTQPSARG